MRKEIAVAATFVALGGGASLYQYLSQGRQVVYQLRHDFCANTNVPLSYSRAAPSMLGACQLPTSLAASDWQSVEICLYGCIKSLRV